MITAGITGLLISNDHYNHVSVKGAIIYVDSVGGGDFNTIQAAIDNATSGDTIIVANGTYYESVIINKTNISLIGNSSSECKIIYHYSGTNMLNDYAAGINITATGVNVTGFNISVTGNYTYGLRLNSTNSSQASIYNNHISTSGSWAHGIYLFNSHMNNITNNKITTILRSYGVYFSTSTNNSITNNTMVAFDYLSFGIYLDPGSWYNNLMNNNISTYGRYGFGIYLDEPSINNMVNNTIKTYDDNGYGIYLSRSSENILNNNDITTSGANGYGIYLNTNCAGNQILNNTIKTTEPDSEAIYIRVTSNYIELRGNNITTYGSNTDNIYIFDSYNINITDNRISNVGHGYGIYFYKGINISLYNNNLTGGGLMMYGPWLYNWDSHTIENTNTINHKPVYYYKNTQTITVPGTPSEVILVNCSVMSVTDKSFVDGGVIIVYSDTTTINNCSFESCSIFVTSSSWIFIINNSFKNSSHLDYSGNCIYVGPQGSNNLIRHNRIALQEGYAIACYSDRSIISNNTVVNNNGTGISIQYSTNIRLEDNNIQTSGQTGFGLELWSSTNNLIKNNVLETQNSRGIYLRSGSNNNNILKNQIKVNKDNVWGLGLDGVSYCSIENNSIETNGYRSYGIRLDGGASFNGILNNEIITTGERAYGICLYNDLFNTQNELKNNTITTYGSRGYGIYLYQSARNRIISNNVTTFGARGDALYLQEAANNEIKENEIITSAGGYGLFVLHESNNNDLVENIVNTSGADGHGVFIRNSDNNKLLNFNIQTSGTNAHGFFLDRYNATIINTSIHTSTGTNSYDIFAINNSAITTINCTFNTVDVANSGGGVLTVKNYLDIQVFYEDGKTPILNADVKILDNGRSIYSSIGYSGFNLGTDINGKISTTLLTDRKYINWNIPIENITRVMVKKFIDLPWEEVRTNVDMSSSHTEIFIASDINAPSAPEDLDAAPMLGADAINISWVPNDDDNDTKLYQLWWIEPKTSQWMQLAEILHPKDFMIWSNESLINGSEYQFKLRAVDKVSLSSDFAEPVSVIHRDYLAPDTPSDLNAVVASENSIILNWNLSTHFDVVGYNIFINSSKSATGKNYTFLGQVGPKTMEYQALGLMSGTTYYFVISSFDEANNTSPFTNEAYATTMSPSIVRYPTVMDTYPENNSTNVHVNTSVSITFNMPMNTTSVKTALDIFPKVGYIVSWNNNNTMIHMDFLNNLDYNTTYTIILGKVEATIGTTLKNWPFELSFKTQPKLEPEPKPEPEPIIPTLKITSPEQGATINANEYISISGTSHSILNGLIINITFASVTETSVIGNDGDWWALIKAPAITGNYTIKATVWNLSDSISIFVKATDEPDGNGDHVDKDNEEDKNKNMGLFGMGAFMDIIIFLLIVLMIVIIALLLVLKLTKRTPEAGDVEYLEE